MESVTGSWATLYRVFKETGEAWHITIKRESPPESILSKSFNELNLDTCAHVGAVVVEWTGKTPKAHIKYRVLSEPEMQSYAVQYWEAKTEKSPA